MILINILMGLAGVLLVLILAILIRTALLKPAQTPAEAPPVDAEAAAIYAQHLSRMIQCETVSAPDIDPAATREAFAELRLVMAEMYPLCHSRLEDIPIEEATLLRWRGKDPSRKPILLLAHSDVVPATGAWSVPPFGGEVRDGNIWGRGAMDTKNSLCAIYEAVEGLLAKGFTPPCDVYLGSSHNEERMGPGAVRMRDWFVENGIELAIVSDEGGAVVQSPMPGLTGWFAMVGLVEKGYANVRFTARSGGGHASIPPKNSPLARIAAFVDEMERHPPFKTAIPSAVRDMFETLAPHMSFGYRCLFGNLWLFAPLVKKLLPSISAQAAAMLRTTCAFTMASGSAAPNVMPETATITANLRFIMHQGMDASLAAIGAVAKRHGLEMEVLYANDIYPAVDTGGAEYQYILQTVHAAFPEAVASPYIMVAGTDARHFATGCRCTVRFSPAMLEAQQLASMHGLDENSGVNALARAVRFYELLLGNYR